MLHRALHPITYRIISDTDIGARVWFTGSDRDQDKEPVIIGYVDKTGEIVLSPYQLILLLSVAGMGKNALQEQIRNAVRDATPIGTLRTVAIYRLGHSSHDLLRALVPLIPTFASRVDWSAPK